ncbi:MAG: molybdopterin-binding protein [Pseudomonadota bacterium]
MMNNPTSMSNPTASYIIIGDEILSGRTADKNLNFIANQLVTLGIDLIEVRVVRDVESEIIQAINELRSKFDYVFTSGGIGPTHDDITAESVAKAFEVELIQHPIAKKILYSYYQKKNIPLNEAKIKMSYVPEGADLIDNTISAAPGFKMENVFVMAGIPKIMQQMFFALKPLLNCGKEILSEDITIHMVESEIAEIMKIIQEKFKDVTIGSYPFVIEGENNNKKFGTNIVIRSQEQDKITKVKNLIETEVNKLINQ